MALLLLPRASPPSFKTYFFRLYHAPSLFLSGANKGIGKETARLLAEQGLRVVLAVRSLEHGRAAAADIAAATGGPQPLVAELDIASPASVDAFGDWVAQELGHCDILVNNAGWGGVGKGGVGAAGR